MRLETISRDVQSGGMTNVVRATVAPSRKIFDMFSDQTYADKPVAILRELAANARDAHVMAGVPDRPIEVVLPTTLDPMCTVRDFGTGMAPDFVMGKFMAYTDGSTKDYDDNQIGGFGIGSKSPFSYVDQYGLRVVYDGVLSIYTMFKDSEGFPSIGLQAQTTTDEPNGVEVSFPVEEADIQTFHEAAQKALQYFTPLPVVSNGTVNPPDYTYVGNGWSMRDKAGELGIIMGAIRYPAVASSMTYELRTSARLSPLLHYGLDLTLPIGACNIATSREALAYTARTSESIKAALEGLIDDVVATFANMFDMQPSRWDAMLALAKETGVDSQYQSSRAKLMLANARYQGTKLDISFVVGIDDYKDVDRLATDFKAWRIDPPHKRRGGKCPASKWGMLPDLYGITPAKVQTLIIDDLPQTPKSKTMQRIRNYVDDMVQSKEVLVVRGPDMPSVLRLLHYPSDYVLTSSMPAPLSVAKAKTDRPRVRMFRFNGKVDKYTQTRITNLTPSAGKTNAVFEVPYPDQPATGIMVVMSSFDLPTDFGRIMDSGLITYGELAFVNQSDADKLKDSYRRFHDVFNERLAKALAARPELAEQLAVRRNPTIANLRQTFKAIKHELFTAAQLKRPIGKLFQLWAGYDAVLSTDDVKLAPFVTAKLPAGAKPEEWWNAVDDDARILINVLDPKEAGHRKLLMKNL